MLLPEITQYIDSLINHEHHLNDVRSSDFKLDRINRLLDLLGNPQESLTSIHIAGSKGKGSTAAFIANILKEGGYTVGLYTSPHIVNYRERIRLLKKTEPSQLDDDLFKDMIAEKELEKYVARIRPLIQQVSEQERLGNVTFYELWTAIAFLFFKESHTDFVVLETGLGGRLDATNVADSLVAVITSISLEHTKLLGTTLKQIAVEKSFIIKDSTKQAVVLHQDNDVVDVIQTRAEDVQVPLTVANYLTDLSVLSADENGQIITIDEGNICVPLLGKHQLANVSVVLKIVEVIRGLNYEISFNAIREGIENVFWPCRFEKISDNPHIVIDAAHNESSIEHLIGTYQMIYPGVKPVVVFGVSDDKLMDSMLSKIGGFSKRIIFTKADHPRARKIDQENLTGVKYPEEHIFTDNLKEALQMVDIQHGEDHVLVTGSVFVASEARKLWAN